MPILRLALNPGDYVAIDGNARAIYVRGSPLMLKSHGQTLLARLRGIYCVLLVASLEHSPLLTQSNYSVQDVIFNGKTPVQLGTVRMVNKT